MVIDVEFDRKDYSLISYHYNSEELEQYDTSRPNSDNEKKFN